MKGICNHDQQQPFCIGIGKERERGVIEFTEIQKSEIEDAILQGIKRWLSRDDVESVFHSMWLEDFEMDFPYEELQEDIEAFSDALFEKMGAAAWLIRGSHYVAGAWDGAVLRLLCERECKAA